MIGSIIVGARFSSVRTSLKPWFSKDSALRIWSPRLAFAERGIRRLGFLRASSSQMAFAPALEIQISARANKSASSFFTYCLHWIYVAPLTSCVVFMIQPESEITVVLIYFACIFLTLIISLLSFLILRILSPRLLLLFTGSRG